MATGPAVTLTIGAAQIERHPLFNTKWPERTAKFINEEMTELFEDIQKQMDREITPTIAVGATKRLKDSFRGKPIKGKGINITGVWGTEVKYGAWHEFGTGPHFPPVAPLMPWVIAKGTFTDSAGVPITESSPDYIVRGMAFIIARAISRRGTIPGNEIETWMQKNEVKTTRKIIDKIISLFDRATRKKI